MGKTKRAARRPKGIAITIPFKYVEQVERGVALLDLIFGRKKWLAKMNMAKFDIESPSSCVAGNVFRDGMFEGDTDGYEQFRTALSKLGVDETDGARFGFYGGTEKGFQYLQDLWTMKIKLLKARR